MALFPLSAAAATCAIEFRFEVTQGVGFIRPGTEMSGAAQFATGDSIQQEGGSVGHFAEGEMSIDGDISGRVWTMITASREHAADFVGVYATDVTGFSFAGIEFNRLTLSLFGQPGTMAAAAPPTSQAEWDALDLRRTLALITHDGSDMLAGDIIELNASCS